MATLQPRRSVPESAVAIYIDKLIKANGKRQAIAGVNLIDNVMPDSAERTTWLSESWAHLRFAVWCQNPTALSGLLEDEVWRPGNERVGIAV